MKVARVELHEPKRVIRTMVCRIDDLQPGDWVEVKVNVNAKCNFLTSGRVLSVADGVGNSDYTVIEVLIKKGAIKGVER